MKKFTILFTIMLAVKLLSAQWIQQNPHYPDTCVLKDIFFIDQSHGWASGSDYIEPFFEMPNYYFTIDGGLNWTSWHDSSLYSFLGMNSIYFLDQDKGWGAYRNSCVCKTIDGGHNWEYHTINIPSYYEPLTSVFFTDSLNGWITGYHNFQAGGYLNNGYIIFHSNDGGNTWAQQVYGKCMLFIGGLFDIGFIDENVGWAVGDKLASTIDGGIIWDIQDLDIIAKSLSIIDQNNLWISGFDFDNEIGSIMASTDGGVTWSQKLGDTIPKLNAIVFPNVYTGWAVGDSGTILHTSDGGETWGYQESGTTADLFSITFTNQNYGWICGDSSIILYTNNGGTVGINEIAINQNKLSLFPNPSTETTNINFEFESPGKVFLSIRSINGQIIKHVPLGIKKTGNYDLNCTEFSPGIYFITVKTESEIITEKLIIE